MAEDAARSALFGSSAARVSKKPNPYAAAPAEDPAAAPPRGGGGGGGGGSGGGGGAALSDDPARAALLVGGRRRAEVAAAAPAAPAPAPGAAVRAAAAAPSETMGEMIEGDLQFDFEDLNLSAALAGGGRDGDDGALDFTAIDADLARFSQDEVIRDALNRGVDLRVYSKQVDTELHAMEALSIADYIRESDSIAGLFGHITSCEGVLTEMQSLLQSFQDKLGGISDEIRSLQDSSMALSVKKQNRKNLAGKVKAVLSKIDVSEGLISRICDAPIDVDWLRDLRALSEKVEFVSGVYRDREARAALATHAPGLAQPALPASEPTVAYALDSLAELTVNPVDTPAGRDAVPQIELLRKKAVARVRDFLMKGVSEVIKPRGSMQKQQEYGLLKFAYAMAFLTEHGGEAAKELRTTYSEGVGRAYGDIFKKYAEDLVKAAQPGPGKGEVLGSFEGAGAGGAAGAGGSGGSSSSGSGGGGAAPRPSMLEHLDIKEGGRGALLAAGDGGLDAPSLAVHVVVSEKLRLPWEAMFRSLQKHLLEVAASEETMVKKFFGDSREARDVLTGALGKCVAAVLEAVEGHASGCWDGVGLLLTLALAAAHKKGHTEKGFKGLGAYFDKIALLVWPRWKMAFTAHLASVQACAVALAKGGAARPPGLAPADAAAPHPLTQRFALFKASITHLHVTALQGAGPPLEDPSLLPNQLCVVAHPRAR
jgi:hypothetical protein